MLEKIEVMVSYPREGLIEKMVCHMSYTFYYSMMYVFLKNLILQNCALEIIGLMGKIAMGSIVKTYAILLPMSDQKQEVLLWERSCMAHRELMAATAG